MKIKLPPDLERFLHGENWGVLSSEIEAVLNDRKSKTSKDDDLPHHITYVEVQNDWKTLNLYLPEVCWKEIIDHPELQTISIEKIGSSCKNLQSHYFYDEETVLGGVHIYYGSSMSPLNKKKILAIISITQKSIDWVFENRHKIQEKIEAEEKEKERTLLKKKGLL